MFVYAFPFYVVWAHILIGCCLESVSRALSDALCAVAAAAAVAAVANTLYIYIYTQTYTHTLKERAIERDQIYQNQYFPS